MFKKFFALFTLLAVLAAGMTLPAGAALIVGENLLVNGNFESFEADGTTPTGWELVSTTEGHAVSVLQDEKSENHYLSLAGDYNLAYAKQVVPLPDDSAGAVYELSWKMQGGESNYSYIQVFFLNSSGERLSESTQQSESYFVKNTGDSLYDTVTIQHNKDNNTNWRPYSHAFAVPVNVKYLEVHLATRHAADKRPVDDFSLRRNDKAAFINYTYDMRMTGNSMHDRNAAPNSNPAGEITAVEAVGKTGTDGVLFYDTTRTDGVKAAFGSTGGTYDYYNAWVVPSKGNFMFSVDVYMQPTPTDSSVLSAKLPMLLQYETRRYVTNGTAAPVENDTKLEMKLYENGPDVKTGQWVTYQYPIPAAALEGETRRASLTIRNYDSAFDGQVYLDNIQIYREETSLSVTDSTGAAITAIPEDGNVNVKYRLVPSYGETNYSEGDILVCAYGENANGTKQLLSFDVLSPVSTDGLPVEATASLDLSGHASLSEVRVFKANELSSLQLTELLTLPKTAPAA